jgi:hypothetical protein
LKAWQLLLLCAAAGAASNVLFVTILFLTDVVWLPSISALLSGLAWDAVKYGALGLVFGAVWLWRRAASTRHLVLLGLAMLAAMDVLYIVVNPMFDRPIGQAPPTMLTLTLVVGSLIYVFNPGAERESPVAKGEREI